MIKATPLHYVSKITNCEQVPQHLKHSNTLYQISSTSDPTSITHSSKCTAVSCKESTRWNKKYRGPRRKIDRAVFHLTNFYLRYNSANSPPGTVVWNRVSRGPKGISRWRVAIIARFETAITHVLAMDAEFQRRILMAKVL